MKTINYVFSGTTIFTANLSPDVLMGISIPKEGDTTIVNDTNWKVGKVETDGDVTTVPLIIKL